MVSKFQMHLTCLSEAASLAIITAVAAGVKLTLSIQLG